MISISPMVLPSHQRPPHLTTWFFQIGSKYDENFEVPNALEWHNKQKLANRKSQIFIKMNLK
jgi:hypothetical protein